MENIERLLTREQAAAYLQISTKTLDRYIKNGNLKPIRVGHLIRFPENVLSVAITLQT